MILCSPLWPPAQGRATPKLIPGTAAGSWQGPQAGIKERVGQHHWRWIVPPRAACFCRGCLSLVEMSIGSSKQVPFTAPNGTQGLWKCPVSPKPFSGVLEKKNTTLSHRNNSQHPSRASRHQVATHSLYVFIPRIDLSDCCCPGS